VPWYQSNSAPPQDDARLRWTWQHYLLTVSVHQTYIHFYPGVHWLAFHKGVDFVFMGMLLWLQVCCLGASCHEPCCLTPGVLV
jgi:hypothetical protein